MLVFAAKRIALLLVTLVIVSILAFLVPYVNGGDPVMSIVQARSADIDVDPEALAAMTKLLGLDRPLHEQYLVWLGQVVQGDFGLSFVSRTPVIERVVPGLLVSTQLAIGALAIAVLLGVPTGMIAATRPDGWIDRFVTFFAQSLIAIPEYWVAPMAMLLFSIHLGWLPIAGWRDWTSMVMPMTILSMRPMAYFTQVSRAAMIEVLGAPYMTAARARGLNARQALLQHGVRNASVPVLTLFSVWLASLLGGSIIIEVIFAVPGMGLLLYEAVTSNDTPLLQAGIIAIVLLCILISTVADIVYSLVNPAIRVAGGNAR